MADANEHALDWDDSIEHEGEDFVLLPAGEGTFEVMELEKGRCKYEGGCNMATLRLAVTTPAGTASMKENLILHSKLEWKLCQFFTCIGQRKHGEMLTPKWNQVVGAKGRCKIKIENWINDKGEKKQSNKIDKFLDPASAVANVAAEPLGDDAF